MTTQSPYVPASVPAETMQRAAHAFLDSLGVDMAALVGFSLTSCGGDPEVMVIATDEEIAGDAEGLTVVGEGPDAFWARRVTLKVER